MTQRFGELLGLKKMGDAAIDYSNVNGNAAPEPRPAPITRANNAQLKVVSVPDSPPLTDTQELRSMQERCGYQNVSISVSYNPTLMAKPEMGIMRYNPDRSPYPTSLIVFFAVGLALAVAGLMGSVISYLWKSYEAELGSYVILAFGTLAIAYTLHCGQQIDDSLSPKNR